MHRPRGRGETTGESRPDLLLCAADIGDLERLERVGDRLRGELFAWVIEILEGDVLEEVGVLRIPTCGDLAP